MIDYVPSRLAMRNFVLEASDEVRNSLEHPLLNVFRYSCDIRQILLKTQEAPAARISEWIR